MAVGYRSAEFYDIRRGDFQPDDDEDEDTLQKAFSLPCSHDTSERIDGKCMVPCDMMLACGDVCQGTCHSCNQGRLHQLCTTACDKRLICNHRCKVPCRNYCPPCAQPCLANCSHGRVCPLICGAPCEPCQRPCNWKCAHLACSKLCYEMCDRGLCRVPCPQTLSCGHGCVGLCGEPCPPCRTCSDPQLFPNILCPGEEFSPGTRFIRLTPCGHNIEVDSLCQWLACSPENGDQQLSLKKCPYCLQNITNNQYLPPIRAAFLDIQRVTRQQFGDQRTLTELSAEVQTRMNELSTTSNGTGVYTSFNGFNFLYSKTRLINLEKMFNEKLLSKYNLSVLVFLFHNLKQVSDTLERCWRGCGDHARKYLTRNIKFLVRKMVSNFKRFGSQQYWDISNETTRFCHLVEMKYLSENPGYSLNKNKPYIKEAFERINSVIQSPKPYVEETAENILELMAEFRKLIKTEPHVSKKEIKMLKSALPELFHGSNRDQRYAYKCSEGHIYFVAGCGLPAEISHCPECNESIGGVNYQVVRTSTAATELYNRADSVEESDMECEYNETGRVNESEQSDIGEEGEESDLGEEEEESDLGEEEEESDLGEEEEESDLGEEEEESDIDHYDSQEYVETDQGEQDDLEWDESNMEEETEDHYESDLSGEFVDTDQGEEHEDSEWDDSNLEEETEDHYESDLSGEFVETDQSEEDLEWDDSNMEEETEDHYESDPSGEFVETDQGEEGEDLEWDDSNMEEETEDHYESDPSGEFVETDQGEEDEEYEEVESNMEEETEDYYESDMAEDCYETDSPQTELFDDYESGLGEEDDF